MTDRQTRPLRAYMAYCGPDGSADGACLVFAPNGRDARKLAYPVILSWMDCEYLEVHVRWLQSGCPHLRQKDEPHVVESPPSCARCTRWYEAPLDGDEHCVACAKEVLASTESFHWITRPDPRLTPAQARIPRRNRKRTSQ